MFYFSTGFFAQRKINCPSCVLRGRCRKRSREEKGGGGRGGGQSEHIK